MGYVEAALEGELDKLRAAQPGNQDNTINEVFFCLACMVKGDWFDEMSATSKAFPIVLSLPIKSKPFTQSYCRSKWQNAMRAAQPRVLPIRKEYNDQKQNNNYIAGHKTSVSSRTPSYPKASILTNQGIPHWTAPADKGGPVFLRDDSSRDALKKQPGELRRHVYVKADGGAVRAKIKFQKQDGSIAWADWYKVRNRRGIGWQSKRPAAYSETPYFLQEGLNPFDEEFIGEALFWTEGEKDAENIARQGKNAFSFGGSSTYIDASDLIRNRHVVILGDNDEAGRKWAERQASIVADACASIKTYTFPQLDEKGDASDFLEKYSIEELEAIIAQLPIWHPEFGYGGELLTDGIVEPPIMLINRLVPAAGLVFAGGQSEAGKTYAMVSLAIALASGNDFLGFHVYNRAAVIYCAAEGEGVLANRFAVAKAHIEFNGQLPILILKRPGYINDDLDIFRRDMRANANWLKRNFNLSYCVFILDTRMAGWRMEDENDNEEAGQVCQALRSIGPEIGGPVIIVHHYGKTKEQGLRGASAWEAGCDHVISIYAEKDQVTGDVAKREIAISRSRFGPTGTIGEFELKYEKLGIGPHDEEFGDCYLDFVGKSAQPKFEPKSKGRPKGGRGDSILRDAIDNAILEAGKIYSVGCGGLAVTAVKMQLVREHFFRHYTTGETTTTDIFSAQRSAWRHAVRRLDKTRYGTEIKGEIEWIWKL